MQQRLGIAQALVGEPRLLLLDEPTSALDPVGRRIVRQLLEELRDRGVSVLLNSHLLSEVELVCDRSRSSAAGNWSRPAHRRAVATRAVSSSRPRRACGYRGRDARGRAAACRRGGRRRPQVYGVRVLTSTLEDVYLEAVGGEID